MNKNGGDRWGCRRHDGVVSLVTDSLLWGQHFVFVLDSRGVDNPPTEGKKTQPRSTSLVAVTTPSRRYPVLGLSTSTWTVLLKD